MKNTISTRLLQGSKFQAKRIAIMTKKIISLQFLFVLLCVFLIRFCLTAQKEFIKVRSSTRKMIVNFHTSDETNHAQSKKMFVNL